MYTYFCSACCASYYQPGEAPTKLIHCKNCNSPCTLETVDEDFNNPFVPAFTYVQGESGDTTCELAVLASMAIAFDIWQARHRKYGRGNISATGAQGCAVRAQDKVSRLLHAYATGSTDTPDESIGDSWVDLLNYAAMGYACHKGEWPLKSEAPDA